MISVYHRAGWSIGNVQQRYIFSTEGGNQMVGRILCGGEWNSDDFAALPPHFVEGAITHEQWRALVPCYELYPARFKVAIPYLVASVVFHEEWLRKNLPSEHPYFKCRLYTSNVSLSHKILSGSGYNVTSKMSASGLPEHARLSIEITDLKHSLGILE